jgi:hypothetical protein
VVSRYDLAAVVALIWADVVPDHEAVVASVVFRDDAMTGAAAVTTGVGVGAVFFFMHAEPVLVSAPIAASYALVGLVGDVVWLSFIFEGHCGASRAVVKKWGDLRGGFHGFESVEHFLLSVRRFALFCEEIPSLLDQLSFSFCQPLFPVCEVSKLTVELD